MNNQRQWKTNVYPLENQLPYAAFNNVCSRKGNWVVKTELFKISY